MASPDSPVLQQLHRLDRSSPNFYNQLYDLLRGDEYARCMPNLQGDDVIWVVDYLDKVRHRTAHPHSPLKSSQVLGDLDPSSTASRECLRELRNICGIKATLPKSYTLSSGRLNIDPEPFIQGGFGDVYRGTLDGLKVCVKRMRVYPQGDGPRKAAEVRFQRPRFPCPPSLMKSTVLLPRGRNVEKVNPPKCVTPPGCHYHPLPACRGMDARWTPTGIHRKTP